MSNESATRASKHSPRLPERSMSSRESTSIMENQLPSCAKDGMKPSDEKKLRLKTCRFLEEASRRLKLPRVATATSMVLFHRFYAVHSFGDHDRFEVAVSCLLLAAKTEESPTKLNRVVQECWKLKTGTRSRVALQNNKLKAGNDPSGNNSPIPPQESSTDKNGYLDLKSKEFIILKERVLLLERVILHTIGFELSIDHPYKFLVDKTKKLVLGPTCLLEYRSSTHTKINHNKMMEELTQNAMNFANDSMHTSLCLQFSAETIAGACVFLSVIHCKLIPKNEKGWAELLGVDFDVRNFESICEQILELIAEKKGNNKEILDTMRSDFEKMKAVASVSGKSAHGMFQKQNQSNANNSSGTSGRDTKRSRIS